MNKLICNSLIASVVAVAGATTFAGQANAQSADVPFTGTVPNTCTFGTVLPGEMKLSSTDKNVLDARNGKPGEITVTCNTTGNIKIDPLTPQNPTAVSFSQKPKYFSGAELWKTANLSGSSFIGTYVGGGQNTGPKSITSNGAPQTFYVAGYVRDDSGTAIPTGTYNYKTTITITADQ